MMLIVKPIDDLKGPKGFPEWLGDSLHWFVNNAKQKKMGTIGFSGGGNKEEWEALGEVLMEEMIFSQEYTMSVIDGSFPTEILDSWVAHLNGERVWNTKGAESCYNYVGSMLSMVPRAKAFNVCWTSVTSANVSPFGVDIFSRFPSHVPDGCNILIASPVKGETDDLVKQFAREPGQEFIYRHMGSWISPLEEYVAYYLGVLEEKQDRVRVFDSNWLEKKIKNKIETKARG